MHDAGSTFRVVWCRQRQVVSEVEQALADMATD
jgi:hypothetical protein